MSLYRAYFVPNGTDPEGELLRVQDNPAVDRRGTRRPIVSVKMQLKAITISVFLGLLIIVTGCDAVRTTRQTISLQVLDLESEKHIQNVRIEVKYDFDKGEPLSEETLEPTEEWHKHRRDSWKQEPWVVGVLENGVFKVSVEKTAIDRSRFSTPPKSRNTVIGKPFLVRITPDAQTETTTEETSIYMNPNELGKTQSFKIVVLNVGEPIYIEDQEEPTH